jgi:hypothetical protein
MSISRYSASRGSAKKLSRALSSQRGFTLVEVAIGAFILVFVFLGALAALQLGFRLMEAARNTTLADQILQSEIEDIRLYNWTKVSSLVSPAPITVPAEVAGQFSGTRTIEDVGGGYTNMKRITVTVEWTSLSKQKKFRSYQTLFSEHGLTDYFVPPDAT